MFQFRYKESKTGMVEALHDPPSSSGVIRLMLHQRYTIQSHEKSNNFEIQHISVLSVQLCYFIQCPKCVPQPSSSKRWFLGASLCLFQQHFRSRELLYYSSRKNIFRPYASTLFVKCNSTCREKSSGNSFLLKKETCLAVY